MNEQQRGSASKPPPIVIEAEWIFEDPRTDALVAIAASMERFAVAAEAVVAALGRAEARALESEPAKELEGPSKMQLGRDET